jgi:hypothetical protein
MNNRTMPHFLPAGGEDARLVRRQADRRFSAAPAGSPSASVTTGLTIPDPITYDSPAESFNSPGNLFAMYRSYVPKLSQEEKLERRKQMANKIKSLPLARRRQAISDVAKEHGVAEPYLITICHEYGIEFRPLPNNPPTARTEKIVAALAKGVAVSTIAKRYKLTRSRVYAIRAAAIEDGRLKLKAAPAAKK